MSDTHTHTHTASERGRPASPWEIDAWGDGLRPASAVTVNEMGQVFFADEMAAGCPAACCHLVGKIWTSVQARVCGRPQSIHPSVYLVSQPAAISSARFGLLSRRARQMTAIYPPIYLDRRSLKDCHLSTRSSRRTCALACPKARSVGGGGVCVPCAGGVGAVAGQKGC